MGLKARARIGDSSVFCDLQEGRLSRIFLCNVVSRARAHTGDSQRYSQMPRLVRTHLHPQAKNLIHADKHVFPPRRAVTSLYFVCVSRTCACGACTLGGRLQHMSLSCDFTRGDVTSLAAACLSRALFFTFSKTQVSALFKVFKFNFHCF